jgi:(p)ppGpp synthase/HD superfamily hydrolase
MYTLGGHKNPEKRVQIADETLQFFVPIAQRLGVWNL